MEDEEQSNGTDAVGEESAVRADEPKTCANCGADVDTKKWHPLATRTDADGNLHVYAFCSEECRNEYGV